MSTTFMPAGKSSGSGASGPMRSMPMRAVGRPRERRMLASVAPLLATIGACGRPSMASHASTAAVTTGASGEVWVPGIASTMSQSSSISGCASVIARRAAPNSRRISAGVERGLVRRSTWKRHSAGVTDAIRGQPPSTAATMPCGATRPSVWRIAYSGNQRSSASMTVAAWAIGLR